MAYSDVLDAEIAVGKSLRKSLFQKFKDNFDSLRSSTSALTAASSKIVLFEQSINLSDQLLGIPMPSTLTLSQYQAIHGIEHVLCDGVAGSSHYEAMGGVIPDLRDNVIRGHRGVDGIGAGEKAGGMSGNLGVFQAQDTKLNGITLRIDNDGEHSHKQRVANAIETNWLVDNYGHGTGPSVNGMSHSTSAVSGGGSSAIMTDTVSSHDHNAALENDGEETRVANIAHNFFMKVNYKVVINLKMREGVTIDIVNTKGYNIVETATAPTGGTLEFNIKKGNDRAALLSIYTTKPNTSVLTDGAATSTGSFIVPTTTIDAGEWVQLEVTSFLVGATGIYLQIYGESA